MQSCNYCADFSLAGNQSQKNLRVRAVKTSGKTSPTEQQYFLDALASLKTMFKIK